MISTFFPKQMGNPVQMRARPKLDSRLFSLFTCVDWRVDEASHWLEFLSIWTINFAP